MKKEFIGPRVAAALILMIALGAWPAPSWSQVSDSDGDGVKDVIDNCVAATNPKQDDSDGDTIGDQCDTADTSSSLISTNVTSDISYASTPWVSVALDQDGVNQMLRIGAGGQTDDLTAANSVNFKPYAVNRGTTLYPVDPTQVAIPYGWQAARRLLAGPQNDPKQYVWSHFAVGSNGVTSLIETDHGNSDSLSGLRNVGYVMEFPDNTWTVTANNAVVTANATAVGYVQLSNGSQTYKVNSLCAFPGDVHTIQDDGISSVAIQSLIEQTGSKPSPSIVAPPEVVGSNIDNGQVAANIVSSHDVEANASVETPSSVLVAKINATTYQYIVTCDSTMIAKNAPYSKNVGIATSVVTDDDVQLPASLTSRYALTFLDAKVTAASGPSGTTVTAKGGDEPFPVQWNGVTAIAGPVDYTAYPNMAPTCKDHDCSQGDSAGVAFAGCKIDASDKLVFNFPDGGAGVGAGANGHRYTANDTCTLSAGLCQVDKLTGSEIVGNRIEVHGAQSGLVTGATSIAIPGLIAVDLANWSRITDPTGKLAVVGLGISNAARPVQGWDGVNNKKVSNALLTDTCTPGDYGTGACSESLASTYPAPAKITVDIGTVDLVQNAPPTSPGGVALAIAVDGSAGSYVNIGSLSKPVSTMTGFAGGVSIGGNSHVDSNGVPDLTAQTVGIAIPVGLENIRMSDLDSAIGVGPGANVSVKYTEVYDTAHGVIGASSGFPKLSSAQSTLSTYAFPKVKSGDEDFQFVKSVGLQSTFLTASNNIFGYDKTAQMVKVGSDPNMPAISSLNGDKTLTCTGTNFDVLVAGSPYCAGRIPVGLGLEKDVETDPSLFSLSLTKSLVGVNSPGIYTANKYTAGASGGLSLQGTCFTPDGSLCNTTGIVSCTTPGSGCNAVVAKEADVATTPPADVGVSIFGNGVSDNLLASWSGGFSGDMSTCSGKLDALKAIFNNSCASAGIKGAGNNLLTNAPNKPLKGCQAGINAASILATKPDGSRLCNDLSRIDFFTNTAAAAKTQCCQ